MQISTPSPPRTRESYDVLQEQETSSQSYEVVPHVYDGNDRECSFCQEEFEHGQRVCRLTCRHMFHAACWENYLRHSADSVSCPNCRGPGRMIAVWPFIDPGLVTQVDPQNASEQVPNLLSSDSGSQRADAEVDQISSGSQEADAAE